MKKIIKEINIAIETLEAVKEQLKGAKATSTPAKVGKSEEKEEESDEDLSELTIQELRKKAKALGLPAGGSKTALIEAINAASEDEDDIDLEELDVKQLLAVCEEAELEDVPERGKKGKKKESDEDYAVRLREFIEENMSEEDDDDDDDDDAVTAADLEEMDDDELKALAKEMDVTDILDKKKKFNRAKAIKALTAVLEEDED